MTKYARVAGTGSALPQKILTNHDLEKMVETSDEWIITRTGIKARHIASGDETAGTLGAQAAKNAMEMAGVEPNDIDMIIVATCTPDRILPSTATMIQKTLGIPACVAFDVGAACAGFSYILSIANQFIANGNAKRILVIGTETMSSLLDWTDRTTCVLFGDGAGAFVLEASEEPGLYGAHVAADGQYQDMLYVPTARVDGPEGALAPKVVMNGKEVFRLAVNTLGQLVVDTLNAHGFSQSDLTWLVPHQANLRIINATAKKLGLPESQVILTLAKHGNTSAASIPLAFDVAVRDGRIKRGDLCLLESFGAGFAWGAALLRY